VYILEKDVFLCSKGEVPTTFLQSALDNTALYAAHVNFCRSIKSIILNNYTLWALAQILALFNPCGNGVLDREMMSSLQARINTLLSMFGRVLTTLSRTCFSCLVESWPHCHEHVLHVW
jgi:hypothetical protein